MIKMNRKKALTFGDLILSAYSTCGPRRAAAVVRFAVNERLIVFRGQRRLVIP
jgi:hypothetical protein